MITPGLLYIWEIHLARIIYYTKTKSLLTVVHIRLHVDHQMAPSTIQKACWISIVSMLSWIQFC